MRWCERQAAAVVVCTVLAASIGAAPGLAQTVRLEELRNGLQVILSPDTRAASADLTVWYRAGTLTEAQGKSGSTHAVSRLMFLGSDRFPAGQHVKRIRAEGGALNSSIRPDYTMFYQTLPPEGLETAIELEADRMRSLAFDDQDVEDVRAALLLQRDEIVRGSALSAGLERLYGLTFEGHPYAWPVGGVEQDIGGLRARDLRAYHKTRFAPERAVITVVGRFDEKETLASIRRHFETLPRRAKPAPQEPAVQASQGERRLVDSGALNPMLLIGWRGPGAASEDMPALELLAEILVGSPGSRLMRNPLKAGVSARGDYDARRQGSLLYCVAALRPGVDTTGVERALIDRIESAAREQISDQEIVRAKKRLAAAVIFGRQSPRGLADQLGTAQVVSGDYRAADRLLETIRGLSAADVQRAARKMLSAEHRNVVWMLSMDREEELGR